ncbi:MAG: polysaccharide deacetylase family protein [Actinomycetota bacterium]
MKRATCVLPVLLAALMLLGGFAAGPAAAADPGFERAIVTVTFDDGYQSIYDAALPIMNAQGIKSTQFIATGNIDSDPFFMTSAELVTLASQGHELASHSVTHADLRSLTPEQLAAELSDSKTYLQTLTGGAVYNFAYPFGFYDATVIAAVQQYYDAARCSDVGYITLIDFDEYLIKTQYVLNTTTPAEVQGWIDHARANRYWLVLLYHQVDDLGGEYSTTPANFDTEMSYLHGTGVAVLTMQDALQEIRPYFQQYTVDAAVTQGLGSVTPQTQTLDYLQQASVDLAPAAGYHTSSIRDNGVAVPVADPYVIGQVRADHQVEVSFAPSQPVVGTVSPAYGPVGTTVSVTGSNFLSQRGASTLSFGGIPAGQYVSWSNTKAVAVVPEGARSGEVAVTTGGGTGARDPGFSVTEPEWYLAEGTNAWGFQTYISVENPGPEQLTADVTYMTGGGSEVAETVTLPAFSQTTLTNDHLGSLLGEVDFSTRIECLEGRTIAVDRTMSWQGQGALSPEGHSSVGVTAPSETWYLPEGSSRWGFETWLLLQNPGASEANVGITYMIEGEGPVAVNRTLPPHSRSSYGMSADIGEKDASIEVDSDVPVIAERAMYRDNRRQGHESIGATAPSDVFYLAEGSSDWGFTTYVLVQNPWAAETDVTITYMTLDGPVEEPTFTMPALSRRTVRVNDTLAGTDFSTRVAGSRPVIAERSMYWNNGTGEASHDSIGLGSPYSTFHLPDGQTSEGRETWTLVQNPNTVDVLAEISYLPQGGGPVVTVVDTIPAGSRRTYGMSDNVEAGRYAVSVVSLTGGLPVVVERSMYWSNRGAGTNTVGTHSQ